MVICEKYFLFFVNYKVGGIVGFCYFCVKCVCSGSVEYDYCRYYFVECFVLIFSVISVIEYWWFKFYGEVNF